MKAHILIVDTSISNQKHYIDCVQQMGVEFAAKSFTEAAPALKWLRENEPRLILVNYRLDDIDGSEFIRKCRQLSSGSTIPIILITAQKDRHFHLTALDAGATDFLESPFTQSEFLERATGLLGQNLHEQEIKTRMSTIEKSGTIDRLDTDKNRHSRSSMLEQIIDTIPIMISATDEHGKCLFNNAYQAAFFDCHPDEMVGKDIWQGLTPVQRNHAVERNRQVFQSGSAIPHYEETISKDGVELIYHCNKSPLLSQDGTTIGVLTTAVDITARKFAEEHRNHLASHDMLTGLPNRTLLAEQIDQSVKNCKKHGSDAALLLFDLDRFKIINDTRGHQVGDRLLREVAQRLVRTIGTSDFAARIGGDEFAIILKDVRHIDEISEKCTQILKAINEPYSISGVEQIIGASIGVTIIPDDGEDNDELLRLSDLAMYEAKRKGRNGFCFFSASLNNIAQADARLELELREALVTDQFTLDYQPIISVESLEYVGVEALIRWNHPTRGRLMPDQFIRIANDSGLMDGIGKWVIEEVCRKIVELREQGVNLPRVAINVSPRQFQSQDIFLEIKSNLDRYTIDPSQIVVEITEELLLEQNDRTRQTLDKLRNLGVSISIDDFGTGYSSLQYLRDLPANSLKIDRAFVSRIETSTADRAIISTIGHLAHALGMRVVAEGVENQAQFDLLQAAGCDEIQGFEIARPLSADKLVELFSKPATATVMPQI